MTIRYRLLLSYSIISLASSILITSMFFIHFSHVLTDEIENDIQIEALSMMQEIDWHVFERIQNIMSWKNLEIMQDIHVQDIDKRLAFFLQEINSSYQGIYQTLTIVDKNKQLIASSKNYVQHTAMIDFSKAKTITINKQPLFLQSQNTPSFLGLSIAIPNQFKPGGLLGYLSAEIDWESIYRILETPLPFLQNRVHSYAFIVNDQNTIIAASQTLRDAHLLYSQLPEQWAINNSMQGTKIINSPFLKANAWIIAWSKSTGHRSYKGIGWKVIVMQPIDNALQPIWEMRYILLIFFIISMLIAAFLSLLSAQHIARPIMQLAQFSRDFMHDQSIRPPTPLHSSKEISELSRQFSLLIDDLERSQKDRVRMAKFAVIAEMAATMAHEIRTPLGILRSSAQMLAREKNTSAIAQEMIGFIHSETERLNSLVTRLLESSQPRATHLSKQILPPLIQHAVELLSHQAQQKNIALCIKNTLDNELLCYDWERLLQVLLNLIINALQHTPDNGRVTIELSHEDGQIFIAISDTGCGISDTQKANIFEPFYTSRQDGIGLGLSVVQQIITEHQGTIDISDNSEGGACFIITLPQTQEDNL